MTRLRPNLAERMLARFAFLLAIPTMMPVALLVAALARVQKSSPLVRALLTPILGAAVFIAFVIAVVVFAPYYAIVRIGSALGIVDTHVARSIIVGQMNEEDGFSAFDIDCTFPIDDVAGASEALTAAIEAIAAQDVARFFRLSGHSVFGPFGTSPADIGARIAAFIESVQYGTSADCWFLFGGEEADVSEDLLAMAREVWSPARVRSVLSRATTCCHVQTMVDQGSHNTRVVVYGRSVDLIRARVVAR